MAAPADPSQWIISVDDHIIEPPHLWTSRLPARYRDSGPRLLEDDRGEAWHYDGKRITVMGLVTQGGRDPSTFSPLPVRYADIEPYCYDPAARLAAMNLDGVLATMCYPNLPRFAGQQFYEAADRQLALLCVRAYNDFMCEEWAGADPGRFIPNVILPLWDPLEAAQEIERCAARGARAVAFSENPASLGLPSIHNPSRYWDPVFRAASDAGMPLGIHVGSSSKMPQASPDAPPIVPPVLMSWRAADTAVDWVFSDAFARFPRLKICLAEGGIGWMPFAIQRCDYGLRQYGSWVDRYVFNADFTVTDRGEGFRTWHHGDQSARHVFRDHVYGCFIDDEHGARSIEEIGATNVMVECDFPHADSAWPHNIDVVTRAIAHLSPEDQYRVRQGNAIELFQFKPAGVPVPA